MQMATHAIGMLQYFPQYLRFIYSKYVSALNGTTYSKINVLLTNYKKNAGCHPDCW